MIGLVDHAQQLDDTWVVQRLVTSNNNNNISKCKCSPHLANLTYRQTLNLRRRALNIPQGPHLTFLQAQQAPCELHTPHVYAQSQKRCPVPE